MGSDSQNVILFPTWQKNLEQASKQALEEKKYTEALAKLNQLLSYNVNKHEVFIGKLICLIELEHYDEAIDLCEELLRFKDKDYYHYVHIYLTILFQTNQYEELILFVDDIMGDEQMPELVREQFEQLYKMSKQINAGLVIKAAQSDLQKLKQVMKSEAYIEQWEYIEKLRKVDAEPPIEVYDYLKNDAMHPVVITALFEWLQDRQIAETVEVQKLGVITTVNPKNTARIKEHDFIKEISRLISDLEQENPSLYDILQHLLYRYTYVTFPIMVPADKNKYVAEALLQTGQNYLNMDVDKESLSDKVLFYMEQIQDCESIYLGILGGKL